MIDTEETFRSYHRELLTRMQTALEGLDETDVDDAAFSGALSSLAGDFVRYAEANQDSLYPAVASLVRSEEEVMAPMTLDVRAIAEYAAEADLAAMETLSTSEDFRRARVRRIRLLAAKLEAIIRLHFDKLERIYLPLLADLPAERRQAVLDDLAVAYGPPSPWPEARSAAGQRAGVLEAADS